MTFASRDAFIVFTSSIKYKDRSKGHRRSKQKAPAQVFTRVLVMKAFAYRLREVWRQIGANAQAYDLIYDLGELHV